MFKKSKNKKTKQASPNNKREKEAKIYPFRFTGKTGDYFKLWIVNVVLITASLGLYFPWAKIRSKNYFYSNTILASAGFKYDAQPLMILKGWAGVALFCLLAWMLFNLAEKNAFLVSAIGIFLLPWILLQSLLFRAKHSSYRDIALRMRPNYADTVKLGMLLSVLLLPALIATPFILPIPDFFTKLAYYFVVEFPVLVIAGPYVLYEYKKFVVTNSYFGETNFGFNATYQQFYKLTITYVLIGILGSSPFMLYNFIFADAISATSLDVLEIIKALGLIVVAVLTWIFALAGWHARTSNLIHNAISLGDNGFDANLQAKDMFFLYLINMIAIIISGGLLIPWARIRMKAYKARHIEMAVENDLDYFIAVNRMTESEPVKGKAPVESLALEFGL